MRRYLITLAALALVLGGLAFYNRFEPSQSKPSLHQVAGVQNQPSLVNQHFSYPGRQGYSALELLKEQYRVETQTFPFGEMVTSINGIRADKEHFWAFYVNNQLAQKGAQDYITTDNDMIQWRLEKNQ